MHTETQKTECTRRELILMIDDIESIDPDCDAQERFQRKIRDIIEYYDKKFKCGIYE